MRHVLAFLPQQPVAPLAIEPENVAAVGLDFVPRSFATGVGSAITMTMTTRIEQPAW